MSPRRLPSSARRALVTHALATLVVTGAVALISSLASAAIAMEVARSNAATAAGTVAHAVAAPLANTAIGTAGPETRALVLGQLQPYLDAGVISRAKVWHVEGDEAVVLFSDEPRNEGVRRPFDPDLATRLDGGEVVVLDVPDDPEHTHEFGEAGLLEAFIGFEDAEGQPMRLELYLPSPAPRSLSDLLGSMLPLAALGPLVLGAATLPLALRLARRLDERESERRELLHAALEASDRERRHLAMRLHDGIIQNLASVGLTLESLGPTTGDLDETRATALAKLSDMVDADIAELRGLLTELTPPEIHGSLQDALRDLAEDLRSASPRVELDIAPGPAVDGDDGVLLYRVARELIRNASEHSGGTMVRVVLRSDAETGVSLTVVDDGHGFDPAAPVAEGHLGLRLIRQVIAEHGGRLNVQADREGMSVCVTLPAGRDRLPTRARPGGAA